ncbi:DUF1080 domain-containing protein [Pedobacter sp. HMF7647]|uniref:DUF1080 domain-containing protein n=1 Tax=Hufsiella arboris TaxID=2695275 RepID=A0A7K1Y4D1_9SPHI|nr:DUF1080 domain-containing protein [Hufsiella arboris]MXV49437.1 DUF1080 domain-containing protein [Hufsiella arboris]
MRKYLSVIICLMAMGASAQENHKPEDTEYLTPVPNVVTPGKGTAAPSDAVVLFDGTDLKNWETKDGKPAAWAMADKAVTVSKGDIQTKQKFTNFQLHIEWRTPAEVKGESQQRGNSGIFLQDRYELQVLDNYNNKTYTNGQAGSIYKQSRPLVNACLPPGEWQIYDVIYTAPVFGKNGDLIVKARVTVLQNGVLVQNGTEIRGTTEYIGQPKVEAHGAAPIRLQDHGNPVSYRNIWIREL